MPDAKFTAALRRCAARAALACCALPACAAPAAIDAAGADARSAQRPAPWTSLRANDDPADFHFVIVGDRTGGARPGVFESALPKINLLEPAFVVSIGDLIEGYTADRARIDREWDEFQGFIGALEAPFFYVAGNHDMSNAPMARAWQERFGPSYYRFVYKDVLFLVLNSELFGMAGDPGTSVPGPWTQAAQLDFARRTLAEFADARWTIVLVHRPLWDSRRGAHPHWRQLEEMLGARDYTVFAGHFHRYVKQVRRDRRYITLATTGGGSSLRGAAYGEFDHVAWVTMTDAGPRVANLMLDGIRDEDIVTASSRAALRALAGAVRSVPRFGAGTAFERGAVAFEVANRGARPLEFSYNVDAGIHLGYAGASAPRAPVPRTVAPGASALVEIPLAAATPIAYGAISPGRLVWTLSAGAETRLQVASALLPVAPLALPSGPAPTLDGALDDWPALPFAVRRQGDVAAPRTLATDISYAFALRESGGDVYFAARVVDDSIVASDALGPRVQDAVVLTIDARSEPARSANVPLYPATRDGHVARMARAHLTLADALPEPADDYLPGSRAAVQWRAARTPTGYAVEARVPGAFLDAEAGGRWRVLRVAVTAVDWDAGEARNRIPWESRGSSGVALHWQPDRFGEAPVAGSGTFVRADARQASGTGAR